MAAIKSDDDIGMQTLGQGDDRCVDAAQWEVAVFLNQRSDVLPVGYFRESNVEAAQGFQKPRLYNRTQAGANKVSGFCQRERRNYQPIAGVRQDPKAAPMIPVITVNGRIQRPSVNDRDAERQLLSSLPIRAPE